MKLTITSTFHTGMAQTFVGLTLGHNTRKYTDCGACCCGWPVARCEYDLSGAGSDDCFAVVETAQKNREIRITIFERE